MQVPRKALDQTSEPVCDHVWIDFVLDRLAQFPCQRDGNALPLQRGLKREMTQFVYSPSAAARDVTFGAAQNERPANAGQLKFVFLTLMRG